jgi:hypothetical protein
VNAEQAPKTGQCKSRPGTPSGKAVGSNENSRCGGKRTENERVASLAGVVATARSQTGNHATRETCLATGGDQPETREG